jgi:hypothetical protein
MEQKTPFEERLKDQLTRAQIDPAFTSRLRAELSQRERELSSPRGAFSFRWSYALVPLLLAAILVFAVGPTKVLAQLQTWLGFVPGAGLVESTSDLRVLAQPVSQTRDGVTVRIKNAVITSDKSRFDIELLNIPYESHFSQNPGQPVCNQQPYLLLPDGTKLLAENNFAPIPKEINEASYVIPCLSMRTLGKAPENWQLPVKFVAAPADLPVYAYNLPEPGITIRQSASDPSTLTDFGKADPGVFPVKDMLDILLAVEKPDSWLIGYGILAEHLDDYLWDEALLAVTDANGQEIATNWYFAESEEFFQAVQEAANKLASYPDPYYSMYHFFELPKGDYAFPLTITQKVLHTRYLDLPPNEELFRFDAGSNPQPGDVIEINQTVKLGDYEAKILNAYVDDKFGQSWRFNIDGGEDVYDLKLSLLDYEAFLGLGRTTPLQAPYQINSGVAFSDLPTGILRVGLLQGPRIALGTYIARGTWQP